MNRRGCLRAAVGAAGIGLAGCLLGDDDSGGASTATPSESVTETPTGTATETASETATETPGETVTETRTETATETPTETDAAAEIGPVAPEPAVEPYNQALDLLRQNQAEFERVSQQLLLQSGEETPSFGVATIYSRTEQATRELDEAAAEDDGSLADHIAYLRDVVQYQEAIAEYNDRYLSLTDSINSGISLFGDGTYEQARIHLQSAKDNLAATQSRLDDAQDAFEPVANRPAIVGGERLSEALGIAGADLERQEQELAWLAAVVPARLAEISATQQVTAGYEAFNNESYATARDAFADGADSYETALAAVQEISIDPSGSQYLRELVRDSDALACEFDHLATEAEAMEQAAQAVLDGDRAAANDYIDDADVAFAEAQSCR